MNLLDQYNLTWECSSGISILIPYGGLVSEATGEQSPKKVDCFYLDANRYQQNGYLLC